MLGKSPRKRWGFACLAAGAILVVDPLATLASTTSSPTDYGTSAVTIGLPSVTVTDPTGTGRNVSLGAVIAQSESAPELLSSITVSGTSLLGHSAPGQTFTTGSGPQSGSYDVPVPAGLPVTGAVNLAHFQLSSASGTTSSLLSALTGQLGVSPLNLATGLGQHGISTQVTPTDSTSAASFVTSALTLKLSDILPASVLNGLPLGVVLSLVQQLNLPVGSLAPVLSAVNQLEGVVQNLDTKLTDLSTAQTQLDSLLTGALQTAEATVAADTQELDQLHSTLASDQSAVTSGQAKVTSDQSIVATANQALSAAQAVVTTACALPLSTACQAAQTALSEAQATATSDLNTLNTDQGVLAAAQAALTGIQQQITNTQQQLTSDQAALNALLAGAGAAVQQAATLVNTLTSTVNGLLTQLQGLLNQLQGTNLSNLLSTLTASVGNGSLLDLGPVTTVLSSGANASSGTASATCAASSLSVLGASVPVPNCAAVSQALSSLGTKLDAVLKLLPVTVPQIQVSGLQTSTQASPKPGSDGSTSASAALSALHVSLPQMKLSGLVDQLTQNLQQQVQQLVSTLASTSSSSPLSLPGITVPAGVSSLVSAVLTQLNTLPTGQALQGLSTVGLDLNGAAIGSTAMFADSSTTSGTATGTATSGTATPSPAVPASNGTLPLTGANPVGILAAGILLLVIGYFLLVLSDWWRPAPARVVGDRRVRG